MLPGWTGPARQERVAGRAPGKPGATAADPDPRNPYLDRFGLLLVLTVLTVVAESLIDLDAIETRLTEALATMLVTALVGGMLLVAVRAAGVGRSLRLAADFTVALAVLVTTVVFAIELLAPGALPRPDIRARRLGWLALSLLAPAVTARRLLRHRAVTTSTLQAAISGYLLMTLAAYYAFQTIDAFETEPFFGGPEPTTSFMYFSLTTITTLGYGDLAPATPLGRLVATSEAVIGQVYLVTIVAMVVGLLAQRWHPLGPADAPSPLGSQGDDVARRVDDVAPRSGEVATRTAAVTTDTPEPRPAPTTRTEEPGD